MRKRKKFEILITFFLGFFIYGQIDSLKSIASNYSKTIFRIALGSVSRFMNALTNEGFLIKVNTTETQLIRREELLQRWILLINGKGFT